MEGVETSYIWQIAYYIQKYFFKKLRSQPM